MSDNKTGKYLKYALGEIILVVVGILIALQINTWKENSVKDQELAVSLNNLHEEIEHNIFYISQGIEKLEQDMRNIEDYIAVLNNENSDLVNDSTIHTMMNNLGRKRLKNLENKSYNNLINSGTIDYVKSNINDSLKNNIIGMQNGFNTYNEMKMRLKAHLENTFRPYLYKHANFIDIEGFKGIAENISNKSYSPLNLTRFINNREFTNLLLIRYGNNEFALSKFNYMRRRFKMIHDDIEHYLSSN